jgi:protein YIPF6
MVCHNHESRTMASNSLHTADLDDLDDPLQPASTSDRTPLTGNIQSQSSSSRGANTQSYLTSSIPGEDRRAPTNTIDETVWETLSRDLLAVWEKMRQVLWPKYLLGGMLMRGGGGIAGDAERGEASALRGLLGRWPDADDVLQGSLSEGLRDWDLW